jgi:hypothetical protein
MRDTLKVPFNADILMKRAQSEVIKVIQTFVDLRRVDELYGEQDTFLVWIQIDGQVQARLVQVAINVVVIVVDVVLGVVELVVVICVEFLHRL